MSKRVTVRDFESSNARKIDLAEKRPGLWKRTRLLRYLVTAILSLLGVIPNYRQCGPQKRQLEIENPPQSAERLEPPAPVPPDRPEKNDSLMPDEKAIRADSSSNLEINASVRDKSPGQTQPIKKGEREEKSKQQAQVSSHPIHPPVIAVDSTFESEKLLSKGAPGHLREGIFDAATNNGPETEPASPNDRAAVHKNNEAIRRSGGVSKGEVIRRREPIYPLKARAAGVSGRVVVEITIDERGEVTSARAVSGHPLLRDAAIDSAKGWRFTPTLLSGIPTKVIGTITFDFKL